MRILMFLVCLLGAVLSLSQGAWANCAVNLVVEAKRADIALCHGDCDIPSTHTVILKPQQKIGGAGCAAYSHVGEFHMNNVEQHDKAFQSLKEGDVVKGTLNYHRPSPHGKSLHSNFHHGLRMLSAKGKDYSLQYMYFRHIGLY